MSLVKSHELLSRRNSRLLVVDVQEKLLAAMPLEIQDFLVEQCQFVCEGARMFGVPVTATEQYPQGLGPTVDELTAFAETRIPKKKFSGLECTNWPTAAEAIDDRFQIVVIGMETHVCILQTVLDLLAAGYQVFVVMDAVASRGALDHNIALQRMSNSGAVITTAESVLFEWCETSESPEFKQLSNLIKGRQSV